MVNLKKYIKGQNGTGMIELMIGAAISVVIIYAVFAALDNYQQSAVKLDIKSHANANAEQILSKFNVLYKTRTDSPTFSSSQATFTANGDLFTFRTTCVQENGIPKSNALNSRCQKCNVNQKQVVQLIKNGALEWQIPSNDNSEKGKGASLCFIPDPADDENITTYVDLGIGLNTARPKLASTEELIAKSKNTNRVIIE
jgi:Tfp pilus assembly protein PilE